MDPIRLNTREAIVYLTLIGASIGLILGLVPLFYGRIKGRARLGVIGFVVSILSGAIWSILPLFVMITFVFLILRNQNAKPVEAVVVNEDPINVSVTESDDK